MTPRWLATLAAAALLLTAAVPFTLAAVRPPPAPPELGAGFGPGPVHPHVPRTAAWADIATDFTPGVDPSSANPCVAGVDPCLGAVVAEMAARADDLGCAHTAPFAFTYLETTRGVEEFLARDGFFVDPAELAHLDALFAVLYFDAIDNWTAGRRDQVPPAWQVAFAAADDRRVSAAADVMLGMNAHISRDLAYAVALLLETTPDPAAADTTDFFLVDEVIAAVQDPMLVGSGERFDPGLATLADTLIPAGAQIDSVALIGIWRAQAYDLGLRLATAPDAAARAAVAAEIERTAFASAVMILNVEASLDLGLDADERQAYCEAQRSAVAAGDAPG